MSSAAAVEAEVVAKRRALQTSLLELRSRLQPAELTKEVGSEVSQRLSVVSGQISDKASSPAGLIGLCAMAFASTYALTGGMQSALKSSKRPAMTDVLQTSSEASRGAKLATIAQLSAALAVGAVISKFIPSTHVERSLLAGVGPELRNIIRTNVSRQAELLVSPASNRFSVINLIALGSVMFMKIRK